MNLDTARATHKNKALPDFDDQFAVERWAWGAPTGSLRLKIKALADKIRIMKDEVSTRSMRLYQSPFALTYQCPVMLQLGAGKQINESVRTLNQNYCSFSSYFPCSSVTDR